MTRAPDFDRAAVLALNAAHLVETGPLSAAELDRLLSLAFHAEALHDPAGALTGFVTALEQGADWPSLNYAWFAARHARFVYVDRIVTAPAARGQGVARRLYAGVFEAARAAGHDRVGAEVNVDPPNPASLAFHAAMGFEPLAEAPLPNGKRVRYLLKRL